MTNLLYACESWRPPAALDPKEFACAGATGITQLLAFVYAHPVHVVFVEKRTWNVSAQNLSRWIKSIRRSVRVILLSDQLLFPREIPAHIDAVLTKDARAELVRDTISALLLMHAN